MDAFELTNPEFWEAGACHVMVNPRDEVAKEEARIIGMWAEGQPALSGHLLFATSGSTGGSKWVALSKDALLDSARMVNRHLSVKADDCWLLALPEFHVGGMGILARCHAASSRWIEYMGKWEPRAYVEQVLTASVTLSSLVPTQLVDIVRVGLRAPSSLRALLIGGGRLGDEIYVRARDLGWPVMETYGMTETSSQVATSTIGSRQLKLLEGWLARNDQSGRLLLNGNRLLTGYVTCHGDDCALEDPKVEGWFATGDIVDVLTDGGSRFLNIHGRVDRCLKILGELVNLAEVERAVVESVGESNDDGEALCLGDFAVVALADERRGHRLQLVGSRDQRDLIERAVNIYNARCLPVARVGSLRMLDGLPRSALGKILYSQL